MVDPVKSDDDRKSRSIPENKAGFTVAASPLNPVKLELGIILVVGFFLLFFVTNMFESQFTQFTILGAFGVLSMLWIIFRVRNLLTEIETD